MKKGISIGLIVAVLCMSFIGVKAAESWLWPTGKAYGYSSITSSYGYRTYNNKNHNGIDCAVPQGTQILASRSGRVLESSSDSSRGNYIVIDHGDGYQTVYMHLSQRNVSSGSQVHRGQVIGLAGRTGSASGVHLHFEIKFNGSYFNPNPADYPIQGSVVNGQRGTVFYAFDVQGGIGTVEYSKNGITNPNQILQKGSRGASVMELQYSLNLLMGTDLNVDGIYGTKTVDAVKQFQSYYGLKADGIAGQNTNNKINELLKGTKKTVILQIGVPVMWVDGVSQAMEAVPIKENGRTLLPIRAVMEAFDASVLWNGEEESVTITRKETEVKFWIGSTTIYRNGEKYLLDTAPVIRNGRSYLPVRFVAESVGLSVDWNEATQTVIIEGERMNE